MRQEIEVEVKPVRFTLEDLLAQDKDANRIFNRIVTRGATIPARSSQEKALMRESFTARRYGVLPPTNKVDVAFSSTGNFTICLLKYNGTTFAGVSKRNPIDRDRTQIGDMIALHRALSNLALGNNPIQI